MQQQKRTEYSFCLCGFESCIIPLILFEILDILKWILLDIADTTALKALRITMIAVDSLCVIAILLLAMFSRSAYVMKLSNLRVCFILLHAITTIGSALLIMFSYANTALYDVDGINVPKALLSSLELLGAVVNMECIKMALTPLHQKKKDDSTDDNSHLFIHVALRNLFMLSVLAANMEFEDYSRTSIAGISLASLVVVITLVEFKCTPSQMLLLFLKRQSSSNNGRFSSNEKGKNKDNGKKGKKKNKNANQLKCRTVVDQTEKVSLFERHHQHNLSQLSIVKQINTHDPSAVIVKSDISICPASPITSAIGLIEPSAHMSRQAFSLLGGKEPSQMMQSEKMRESLMMMSRKSLGGLSVKSNPNYLQTQGVDVMNQEERSDMRLYLGKSKPSADQSQIRKKQMSENMISVQQNNQVFSINIKRDQESSNSFGRDDDELNDEDQEYDEIEIEMRAAKKKTMNLRRKQFLRTSLLSRKKRPTRHTVESAQMLYVPQSLRSIDELTPVYQVIENISLGLLCYDVQFDQLVDTIVETKEIVFTNGQIKEIFNETHDDDVLRVMLQQKNYITQHESASPNHVNVNGGGGGGGAAGVVSRNLDMLPADLFSQDYRLASTLNNINIQPSMTDFHKQQKTAAVSMLQQTMTQLNAMEGRNFEKENIKGGAGESRRVIYSQAKTLKVQLKELVDAIQSDDVESETLMESKIRFMAQRKGAAGSKDKEKILQITLTPLLSSEKLIVLFIVEDVTYFNQIKVLESLNKNKSFMLSQVSHEIRNPVSCIIAMLEEIQTASVGKEKNVIDCCSSALQSSKLLLNLLNDLLDMSQIKAGKFKLILDSFNLFELLEEVKNMMQPLARHKSNTICVQIDETFDRRMFMVKSDKYRIRQILINLISNSIKYTHKGRIILSASLERFDERYLRISVRDEGIGIKKEFRQNLFQAFGVAEDIENKAKNNPHGVGLGLLISNTIAKNLKPALFTTMLTGASSIYTLNGKSQFQTKSIATVKDRQICASPRQLPSHSHEVGLMLNEEIEVGSEFYFSIYNYATPHSNLHNNESPLPPGQTPRNRNISGFVNIKRSTVFQHDDMFSLNAPSLTSPHDFSIPQSGAYGQSQSFWRLQQNKSLEAMGSEAGSSKEDEDTIIPGTSGYGASSLTNAAMWIDGIDVSGGGRNKSGQTRQQTSSSSIKKRSKSAYRQGAGNSLSGVIAEHAMKKDEAWRFMDLEMHIMVVDDDQFSAMALKSKIASAFKLFNKNVGISFSVFYSGDECVEELLKRDKVYSYMFIDCQMPGKDGYETVDLIDQHGLRQYRNDELSSQIQEDEEEEEEYEDENYCDDQVKAKKNGMALQETPFFDEMQIVLCSGMPKEDLKFYDSDIPFFLLKPIDQQSLLAIIKQTFEDAYANLNGIDANSTTAAARRGTLYSYSIQ